MNHQCRPAHASCMFFLWSWHVSYVFQPITCGYTRPRYCDIVSVTTSRAEQLWELHGFTYYLSPQLFAPKPHGCWTLVVVSSLPSISVHGTWLCSATTLHSECKHSGSLLCWCTVSTLLSHWPCSAQTLQGWFISMRSSSEVLNLPLTPGKTLHSIGKSSWTFLLWKIMFLLKIALFHMLYGFNFHHLMKQNFFSLSFVSSLVEQVFPWNA